MYVLLIERSLGSLSVRALNLSIIWEEINMNIRTKNRALIYSRNKIGPSTYPWGTLKENNIIEKKFYLNFFASYWIKITYLIQEINCNLLTFKFN